ncbi:hypothetical protein Natpe_4165 (plasmid) [Natrinema pellirubrum DSM 15624]|uniref:Uncharacterized protein n=1 Tax=Natrinema pellirubrum (strain DSM 15624 / CIP 106293 / JCM 10476 / NCIMB 786 / 157) TaxID=797303 RepID=L0JSV2_NATP1|nr:hypothetical protein [Natrinema pellirubrum]AGB33878.1 hypothetical protein Natpe_4165 [Natrinema pellirubrum DSM 15624]
MANIELDLDDDAILIEDHNQQQQLIATRSGDSWRVLEEPIDKSNQLATRTTVNTPTQALIETLRWLAENE